MAEDNPTQEQQAPPEPPKRGPRRPIYNWRQVWTLVLTQPGVMTFEHIIEDPGATRERAIRWVFVSQMIAALLPFLAFLIAFRPAFIGVAVLRATAAGIIGAVTFVVLALLVQWLARQLDGRGTYDQALYAFASYYAPLAIIDGLLVFFPPTLGLFLTSFALSIYRLVLFGMALRAVNGFSWGRVTFLMLALFGLLSLVIGALLTVGGILVALFLS